MTWPLAVAGTVHRDDITTPLGRQESLGGSAVYFALAASQRAPVLLNAIVGRDCVDAVRSLIEARDIDLEGLLVGDCPTFVWHADHDFERWVTAREHVEAGCDPEWEPRLPRSSARAEVLFVASMRPEAQRAVLDQSRARLVGADTMTVYTGSQRESVLAVLQRADLLFLNRAELASITGDGDWSRSARDLLGSGRVRAVIVKHGPEGAALVTLRGIVERQAHPAAQVVDPTGAGDALAGGFLSHCARAEREDDAAFVEALAAGLECAARTISTFGTAGLRGFVARG